MTSSHTSTSPPSHLLRDHHAIMDFPFEITTQIMVFATQAYYSPSSSKTPSSNEDYDGWRYLLSPFTLSQVCRGWRTFVYSNPIFWSTVVIDLPSRVLNAWDGEREEAMHVLNPSFLEAWFGRSKDLPLDVYIRYHSSPSAARSYPYSTASADRGFSDLPPDADADPDRLRNALGRMHYTVARHAHRIRSLTLDSLTSSVWLSQLMKASQEWYIARCASAVRTTRAGAELARRSVRGLSRDRGPVQQTQTQAQPGRAGGEVQMEDVHAYTLILPACESFTIRGPQPEPENGWPPRPFMIGCLDIRAPHLQSLHVANFSRTRHIDSWIFHPRNSLSKVVFSNCTLTGTKDPASVWRLYPGVSEAVLLDLGMDEGYRDVKEQEGEVVHHQFLKSLTVKAKGWKECLGILRPLRAPGLEKLDMTIERADDSFCVEDLSGFLRESGGNLKSIAIHGASIEERHLRGLVERIPGLQKLVLGAGTTKVEELDVTRLKESRTAA